jgi:hypothetical protein
MSCAILINTSRGPLADEATLLEAVRGGRIIAALDVCDREPPPQNHPLRNAPNTVSTPHLGYGVKETWVEFYGQSLENALAFLAGKPVRVTNPKALRRPSPKSPMLPLAGTRRLVASWEAGVRSDASVAEALQRAVATEFPWPRVKRNAQSHSGLDSHQILSRDVRF